MKKILIVLFIAVMVLIIPTPKQMDDETSLHLDALLYDVYLVNRWDPDMPVYEYDEDGNKKCDRCDEDFNPECTEHRDANENKKCDECGADISGNGTVVLPPHIIK